MNIDSEICQKLVAAGVALSDIGLSSGNAIVSFLSFTSQMSAGRKKWKNEIITDWQKTFYMPRKMKKQRRKDLLLDWSIANYDPFNHF